MALCGDKIGLSTSAQSISDWSNPSLIDIVDLIAPNPDDNDVIKSPADLFWTLLFVCHEDLSGIFCVRILASYIHLLGSISP